MLKSGFKNRESLFLRGTKGGLDREFPDILVSGCLYLDGACQVMWIPEICNKLPTKARGIMQSIAPGDAERSVRSGMGRWIEVP